MNSVQSILVVFLLTFAVCDAKILPRQELKTTDVPPPCGNCSIGITQMQGLAEELKNLEPALQKAATLLTDAFDNLAWTNLDHLKLAFQILILDIRVTIGPVLDKLYQAVKNIESCLALKDLFSKLQVHLMAILDILNKRWIPFIDDPDATSTLTQLSVALQNAVPDILKLLRDLSYSLSQVLGVCDSVGQTIWNVFDPVTTNKFVDTLKVALQNWGGKGSLGSLDSLLCLLRLIGQTGITVTGLVCIISDQVGIPNPLGSPCSPC